MRVIYLDVLFIINAYITVLQLAATGKLCATRLKGLKIAIGGALGGVSSFLYFLPLVSFPRFLLNLCSAAAIVLCAFGFGAASVFFKRVLAFTGTGAVMAGLILLLQFLLKPADPMYERGAVYLEIQPMTLIGVTAACYLLLRLFVRLTAKQPPKAPCILKIFFAGRQIELNAITDSANFLHDSVSGLPAAVVSLESVKPLFKDAQELLPFFETMDISACKGSPLYNRLRVLPCRTISQSSVLAAFKPDSVTVTGGAEFSQIKNADILIAVTIIPISDEYSALLPASVMK